MWNILFFASVTLALCKKNKTMRGCQKSVLLFIFTCLNSSHVSDTKQSNFSVKTKRAFWRYLDAEKLVSSLLMLHHLQSCTYHTPFLWLCLVSSCLRAIRQLQKNGHIPSDPSLFKSYAQYGHFVDVRIAALEALVDYTRGRRNNTRLLGGNQSFGSTSMILAVHCQHFY